MKCQGFFMHTGSGKFFLVFAFSWPILLFTYMEKECYTFNVPIGSVLC